MLLLIRFVMTLVAVVFRPRIDPLGSSVVRFTVLPNDCDLNFHLNAGRYLSFMDIARAELAGRTGILLKVVRRGWNLVIGGALVRYRRSILPFERFTITSRIVGWDEKWFYIEQLVERNGALCASAYARALFRKKEGTATPREALALLGFEDTDSPALPAIVEQWRAAEAAR